jgi:hypothetical protein
MASRSAEATIKGYYYQFDTSILKLLNLVNIYDSVTLEGIEDIDIHTATDTTAVQCKYLSKPKFIHSAVKDPIILMLSHFVSSTSQVINYVLYAHFENEVGGNEHIIDLLALKNILTYKENKIQRSYHLDNGLTDSQLNDFLFKFKLIFGKKFEDQQREVILKLKARFNCSEFEADTLHYNNALRTIIDTSTISDITKRRLTQHQFITSINISKKLFNEWYIKLRSKKEYLKLTASAIKATKSNLPSKSKYLFIGAEILKADNSELPIKMFIENLVHKYFKLGACLRNAKPLTVILEIDGLILRDLKKGLISEGISFNDGHEEISFNNNFFNEEPVINTNKAGNKITRASYLIKLVSINTFKSNWTNINKPKVVINCAKCDCVYEQSTDYNLFDIEHCENLKDILTLL